MYTFRGHIEGRGGAFFYGGISLKQQNTIRGERVSKNRKFRTTTFMDGPQGYQAPVIRRTPMGSIYR